MTTEKEKLLLDFAEWIKDNYTLGQTFGGMFSQEFCESNPPKEWLVEQFKKEKVS